MKKTIRFISAVMFVLVLIGILPVGAFIDGHTDTADGITAQSAGGTLAGINNLPEEQAHYDAVNMPPEGFFEPERHNERDPLFDGMPDDSIGNPEAEQADFATEALAYEGAIATSFASGTGTKADPYIIMSGEQLAYLAQLVNTYAADTNGGYYNTKSYKLGADITVDSSVQWDPIGNGYSYRFYGIFDGDGHTVSGLYIDSTGDNKGLFGCVYGSSAIVKNVGVINSSIKGGDYVGGVVGYNYEGTVSGCYNTGAVTGNDEVGGVVGYNAFGSTVSGSYNTGAVTGNDEVGGVVGLIYKSTVSGCYNTGAVTGNGDDSKVGGMVGYNYEGAVSNCYNIGTITGSSYTGGVVGHNYNYGTVSNCYNTGAVTGSSSSEYIGAIVGGGNTPYNSYYLDTLDAAGSGIPLTAAELESPYTAYLLNSNGFDTATAVYSIWGHDGTKPVFASEAHPAITSKPAETYEITLPDIDWYTNGVYEISTYEELLGLSRLVNSGTDTFESKTVKLTADITLGGEDEYWEPIGNDDGRFQGVFDGQSHTVSGMYIDTGCRCQGLFGYIGTSTIVKNVGVINSSIKGGTCIGGVVGYNWRGTVSGCYNTGAVTGNGNSIGGVVGYNSYGTVSGCYNTGTVTGSLDHVGGVVGVNYGTVSDCYNTGSVTGNSYVGGVVGYNAYGTVSGCYNTGMVTGSSYSEYIGAIVGTGSAPYNSYYLDALDAAGSGIPLTAAEFKSPYTAYLLNSNGFDTATVVYSIWGHDGTKPVFASEAYPAITSKPTETYDITLPDIDWYTNGVYEISTYEELLGLSRLVNSGTDTFKDKTVKLTADITLGGEDEYWEPIGNSERSFRGSFDGQSHTVSGMYIDTGCFYQGLFGYIKGTSAIVKNIGVINSSIKGGDYVGGVVGYSDYGTVCGCYNTGAVTGSDSSVGGVVGNNECGTVSGCYNTGAVTGGNSYVGGVVGHNGGTVSSCYNTGAVTGSIYIGGVVGYNDNGTVSGCYNTGAVTESIYIGGVVGYNDNGTVSGCYNTGAITGSGNYVGGMVGYNYIGAVSGCYNTGAVTGGGPVGGVVGWNPGSSSEYAVVEYCYTVGDVIDNGTHIDCAIGHNSINVTVTSVYFLDTEYENITSKCAPLTDAQMRDTVNYAANYAGFDFTDTWTMGGNPDYLYAELTAFPHLMPPASTITGDADGDGAVTWADSYLIAHYLAGWDGTDGIDLTASDADGDGTVTWADATVVARHLAGWTGYETLPYTAAP